MYAQMDEMAAAMPIAIVGMSCRFPGGAESPEDFWDLLYNGSSSWSKVPEARFNAKAFYDPDPKIRGTFNCEGAHFLNSDVRKFDAQFFGINLKEAATMDPQQRLQLECAYEALESGGMCIADLAGSDTSVFVSIFNKDYDRMLFRDPDNIPMYHMVGNGEAILSNRISHFFDLRGPSVTLDTGCSGGLVALHLACQSIRTGESKQAIVGGTNLILAPDIMASLSQIGFFSPQGRCYSHDERAAGYGRGEGAAALLIKPLRDALHDGDPIRAVIRSTAVNQDGRTQGITLPSKDAQIALIRSAYMNARLDFSKTAYCEGHGTGTAVGDPIEADAIANVFGGMRTSQEPVYLGSVKTNIGHLESASGLAGLIKTVLMLERGKIVPNHDFQKLNSKIRTSGWSLKIPSSLLDWPVDGVRQASVNSFGYGGTNCHAVLDNSHDFSSHLGPSRCIPNLYNDAEIVPTQNHRMNSKKSDFGALTNGISIPDGVRHLFVVSGKSSQACAAQRAALRTYLEKKGSQTSPEFLSNLSYTLCSRRSSFAWRWATSATTLAELSESLNQDLSPNQGIRLGSKIGFVFTGQGSQWHAMGRELFHQNAIFAASLRRGDKCVKMLGAPVSLIDELFKDEAESCVTLARIGQPLVTALQLALVDLLTFWGIKPFGVMGHSSGEIAAAYAAGILSHESAMAVAYWRGEYASRIRSNRSQHKGCMMAVSLSEYDAQKHIAQSPTWKEKIVIACSNSPSSVTLSGDSTCMVEIQKYLESREISARLLKVDTAYHSHHMQSMSGDYLASIKHISPIETSSHTSFFSSVTATQLSWKDIRPSYWIQNLVSKVRFHEALQEMCDRCRLMDSEGKGLDILIELGPHAALATPIRQTLQTGDTANAEIIYLPSLKRKEDAVLSIHHLASQLWSFGVALDLGMLRAPGLPARPKPLTDLPSYQWDRSMKHWSEPRMSKEYRHRPHARHELLGTRSIDFDPILPKWRNNLRLSEVSWLRDHVVESQIIYPAAAFLAMVMEAARQTVIDRFGSDMVLQSIRFRDVAIDSALILYDDSDGVEVVTTLQPLNDNTNDRSSTEYSFRVRSFGQQEDVIVHCQGCIVVNHSSQQRKRTLGTKRVILPDRSVHQPQEIEKEAIYEEFSRRNIQYRGVFASLAQISKVNDSALATVNPPAFVKNRSNDSSTFAFVHPTVLDGCFQVLLALSLESKHIRRPPLLNYIRVLDIEYTPLILTCDQLRLNAQTCSAGSLTTRGEFEAWSNKDHVKQSPVISGAGIKITAISRLDDDTTAMRARIYRNEFVPDIELLEPSKAEDICCAGVLEPEKSANEELEALETLSLYFVQRATQTLGSSSYLSKELGHLRHLWRWMEMFIEQNANSEHPNYTSWDEVEVTRLVHKVQEFGDEGKMLVRMGYHLPAILNGTAQPLPLMLEDDLLSSFYHNDSLSRCYTQMGKYLQLLGLKHPQMAILEIGAGTGGTTVSVLEALSRKRAEDGFMFKSYDFTDISSGFFDKAQSLLERWKGSVSYKRLDIEKRPSSQGFTPGTYDMVIASNVLHATCDIENTIRNVRELLKPGGKFVLLEITRLQAHLNVSFGGLPGWWAGVSDGRVSSPLMTQALWGQKLRCNSFSAFNACLSDYDGEARRTEVLVSTAVELESFYANPKLTICIDRSNDVAVSIARGLEKSFEVLDLVEITDIWGDPSILNGKLCLFLGDMTGELLTSWPYSKTKDLLHLLSSSAKALWVTRRSIGSSISQSDSLVTGFTRSWNKNHNTAICTLSLSVSSKIHEQTSVIRTILQSFLKPSESPSEMEYIESQGQVTISRLLIDELATDRMVYNLEAKIPKARTFQQGDQPVKIEDAGSKPGSKIVFARGSNASGSLGKDEVEILPQFVSLRPRNDALLFAENEPVREAVTECSGTIRRLGPNSKSPFRVGDRVCAIGPGPACNHFRVSADMAHPIPSHVSYEEALPIPRVLVTALYSLKQIAKAQRGESILIYQAAGTLGQAVVTLAQLLHLDIYVVTDQPSEQSLLTERFGIPVTRMFSTSEIDIGEAIWRTENHGRFDIIVGGRSQDLFTEALRCIACSGTIICLGSTPGTTSLSRHEQPQVHCTISIVDADLLYYQEGRLFQSLFAEIIELVRNGAVKLPLLTHIMPLSADSNKQKWFGDLNAGRYFLKSGCNTTILDKGKITPTAYPRQDASYIVVGDGSGIDNLVCKWLRNRELMDVHLLLPSNKSETKISSLRNESKGINTSSAVSVCDSTSLKSVIDSIKRKGGLIGGVFYVGFARTSHTESDGAQQNGLNLPEKTTSDASLQHTLGALVDEELDFFAAISSVWGVIGAPHIEQAMSSTHHSNVIASSDCRKFPVLALDVGMITNPGHASIKDSREHRAIDLKSPLFEHSFSAVLDSAFERNLPKGTMTNMVVDLASGNITDGRCPVSPDPRFLHTGSPKSMNKLIQKDEPQSLEQELQSCQDLESSVLVLYTSLAKRLGKLLACPQEDFKPSSSIAQFGIDSLVAAELRAWILQSLGSSITISEILGRDTLIEIARNIAQRSSLIKKNLMETTETPPKIARRQSQAVNGTSKHSIVTNGEQTVHGKTYTLRYQDSLPRMPVPSLPATLENYLLSIRPLLTDIEYILSENRVKEFGKEGGMGGVLQERLEARSKDPKIMNWLYEYWVTHYYLNPRTSIAPETNFFMAHEETAIEHSMAKRAAIITKAVIDFKHDWDTGSLEPAMLHEAPICMESYHWLFNSCRIPKLGGDQSRKAQTSNHVTVVWRNLFFRLEAEQHGRILNVWELESLFTHLLNEHSTAPGPGFGVLTTENRDLWAQTRDDIQNLHEENVASIDSIESSAFVICLDEEFPSTSEERAHQFWHGNGTNRYSDKPLQFIVTPGNSGFNGEHSRLDGSPTIRLNKHVNKRLLEFTEDKFFKPEISNSGLLLPTKLPIHLSNEVLATIDRAKTRFDRAVADCQLQVLHYDGFGETFLRKMGCHPSTVLQMVFQLATYRFYGKSIPSFEPVGNFRFKQGRYDAVRSLSKETALFCASMTNKDNSPGSANGPEDQIKLLRNAMNMHIKRTRDLSYGGSLDNHMFGLWMSLRKDEKTPEIFTDPIYRYSTVWFFSTSYMPADQMEYGFGPDVKTGWSVQYPIWPDKIMFCITSKTFKAQEMSDQIRKAADDIKNLLLIQNQIVKGTKFHLA